jgi:hypothetical protein
MGGLIARYALGLLANPKNCQVAGLNPGHFVSIAAPHLGCCSDHPEEVCFGVACNVLFVVYFSVAALLACSACDRSTAHWELQIA